VHGIARRTELVLVEIGKDGRITKEIEVLNTGKLTIELRQEQTTSFDAQVQECRMANNPDEVVLLDDWTIQVAEGMDTLDNQPPKKPGEPNGEPHTAAHVAVSPNAAALLR
jgi:hypothetical protein